MILWWAFGEKLLIASGVFLGLSVGIGSLYVRRARPRVGITRRISPAQVHDGDRAIVDLSITSSRPTRHIALTDEVHGLGTAQFTGDAISPASPMVARYEILCRPRGVYRVGPAEVLVRGPMAMVESGGAVGKADRLVVYPAVEDLDGLPIVRGQDPTVNSAKANFSHVGGDDFFTLREYQDGDDLRRVHWPTSARRETLMIKQLEMPWQSRALVLLDPRSEAYPTPEHFEHAVRAAASVVRHLYKAGFSPSLWAGSAPRTVSSNVTYEAAMETLATITPLRAFDLRIAASRMRRDGVGGGALVMITSQADDANLAVYRVLSRDFLRTLVMAATQKRTDAILQLQSAGAAAVVVAPGEHWAPEWRDTIERSWSTATPG